MRTGRLQSVYHRPSSRGAFSWLSGWPSQISVRRLAAEEDAHLEAALESALKFVLAMPSAKECGFYGLGDALGPALVHAAGFAAKRGADGLRFVHFQDTPETRGEYGGEVEIEPCGGPLSGQRTFDLSRRLDLPRAAIVLVDPRQECAIEATASLIGTATDERSIVILGAGVENDAIMPRLLASEAWAAEVLLRFGREREGRVLALKRRASHLRSVGGRVLTRSP